VKHDGGIAIGSTVTGFGILGAGIFAHVKYRSSVFFVNRATDMATFCPGVWLFLGLIKPGLSLSACCANTTFIVTHGLITDPSIARIVVQSAFL
jgi:hypothetical protein